MNPAAEFCTSEPKSTDREAGRGKTNQPAVDLPARLPGNQSFAIWRTLV